MILVRFIYTINYLRNFTIQKKAVRLGPTAFYKIIKPWDIQAMAHGFF